MLTPEQIQQIAHFIQPKLFDLLPHEIADPINTELTELITKANAGESVEQAILDLLYEQESLRQYFTIDSLKLFEPLGGNPPATASSLTYKCPECNYTTDIPFQGMTPDPCPQHPTAKLQRL